MPLDLSIHGISLLQDQSTSLSSDRVVYQSYSIRVSRAKREGQRERQEVIVLQRSSPGSRWKRCVKR